MIRGVAGRAGWLIIGLGLIVTALFWILLASPHGRRSASARTGGVRDSPGPPADPAVAASGAADEEIAPGREPFASARRLRIRVVSATAPLPDAEIRFDGDPACAVTGPDGVAELGTEDLGVVFVVASKEGFREVEKAVPGGIDEAEIALVPGVPLRG
ncbi:MAG: hypothetical protein L6Q95_08425, partial [Planctomycetes bacterium]|nr:hypothetical protein [Planctomycetota bacterium]